MKLSFEIDAIAIISSPYTQKFGIPRQPGLVSEAKIHLILDEHYSLNSVRGLEEFEYIWVFFVFHDAIAEGWSELVRPPRLGGKIKKGVFATRTPHRPNHLGLSLLKLEQIQLDKPITLVCSGGDLLDGTPVVDIKPYIPFVEAKPNACSGFVDGKPPQLTVIWTETAFKQLQQLEINQKLVEQVLAQDPRPAYQNIPDRLYFLQLDGHEVQFKINAEQVSIVFITKQ